MTVCIYKTRDGVEYIKVARSLNGELKQLNIRIPKVLKEGELEQLLEDARLQDRNLFVHPETNFLEWYWAKGRPRNIYIDRTNVRLVLSRTLVKQIPLAEQLSLSFGLTHCGISEASSLLTGAFFHAHGEELESIDQFEFKARLSAWLLKNHNS